MGELEFSDKFLRGYRNGDLVFEEGSVGEHAYVILSGRVDIVRKTRDGEALVRTLGKGEIFGEMALVDQLPRSASAVSRADDTSLVAINHAYFVYLVGQQPAFALILLKAMSLRLRAQMEKESAAAGKGASS